MKGMQTDMNEKIYDVTALGELLIDFTENGKTKYSEIYAYY